MNSLYERFKRSVISFWTSDDDACQGAALHAKDGNNHTILMKSIRVLIVQDGEETWYAQSIDIDYAACGSSLENVQHNFAHGLKGTLKANLKRYGHVDRVMQTPPMSDWKYLLSENFQAFEHSNVSSHKINDSAEELVEEITFENCPPIQIHFYPQLAA